MDFEYRYSEEQEQFRSEVSAWLDANLPEGLAGAAGAAMLDSPGWEQCQNFRRRLGEKGWLALNIDLALVFLEELGKRKLGWLLDDGSSAIQTALQRWGTENQKKSYLPLIADGEANVWRFLAEPGVRLDVGSLGIRASREGDEIILNGQDTFAGQGLWPDYLWTIAVINPDFPPHRATSSFLVPSGLNGISIQSPRALVPGQTHRVTFDHVVVYPDALLGDEGSGWSIMQTALQSPQTIQYPIAEDAEVGDLLQYAKDTVRDGASLGKDLVLQQLLVEAHINSRITRLFKMRNAWLASTGQKITYELAQTALWEKQISMRLSRIVRDVMGMYALLDPQDPRAAVKGKLEFQQRSSLAIQNPSAVPEPYAVAIADALGLGKGQQGGQKIASPGAPTGASGSGDV
ncbi:MAG: acyl-CoA dehydrogenase family protein [Dehalococcoidia bacterium]|nr:acyl-CoA dehydrogenase family protein [Dehalococcoidia bacterium]